MFSYTQNDIDESVEPVRQQHQRTAARHDEPGPATSRTSRLLFRDTNASSEAVINGAALEKIDDDRRHGRVLVAVRVTVTDLDGNNAPSKPYRLRVIVHEDDNGHMSFYDLKYPDGGN